MKRIAILGHFAFGHEASNGQTIKTKIFANELQRIFGETDITLADTYGGWRFILRMPFVIFRLLATHRNLIIFPASGSSRVLPIIMALENLFFHRRLHHVAIGSQLPRWVKGSWMLRRSLRTFCGIYVETKFMKQQLNDLSLQNVAIMPNCKRLEILNDSELPEPARPPYKLCTFSRVMEEKGIADAIEAVKRCNNMFGKTIFTLDIYGQVEQQEWFDNLMKDQPSEIAYKGIVPFGKSTQVLRDYFLLLFPTRYKIEGFAGTLIDAMAAGLPVIASDCRSNVEILKERRTGLFYTLGLVDELTDRLEAIAKEPMSIEEMRPYCIKEAHLYQPNNVVKILSERLL